MNKNEDVTRKINKENFNYFLNYMKEKKGVSPASIVKKIGLAGIAGFDDSIISKLRHNGGSVKNEILQKLHEEYNVNPDFLLGDSSNMFDNIASQFKGFNTFVKHWETVIKTERTEDGKQKRIPYLHLSINRKFYDFLLEVDQKELYTKEGYLTESDYIDKINSIFNKQNESEQNFVLIPCKDFINIIEDYIKAEKALDEVLNPAEHRAYLKPSLPKIVKKKK